MQRAGDALGRRHAKLAGVHEGEKLQNVIGRKTLQPQPCRHLRRVADDGHVLADGGGGLFIVQLHQFAVKRQAMNGPPEQRQHGRMRYQKASLRRLEGSGLGHSVGFASLLLVLVLF